MRNQPHNLLTALFTNLARAIYQRIQMAALHSKAFQYLGKLEIRHSTVINEYRLDLLWALVLGGYQKASQIIGLCIRNFTFGEEELLLMEFGKGW